MHWSVSWKGLNILPRASAGGGEDVNSDATGYAWEVALSPFDLKSILLACEELIQKRSATGQTEGSTAQAISQI